MLRLAPGPSMTPFGLSRKRLALGMAERVSTSPSMVETWPPVTRLITFAIEPGPLNVALSPFFTLNRPKLWKRLLPTVRPRSEPMMKFGPARGPAGPRLPSNVICARLSATGSRTPASTSPPATRARTDLTFCASRTPTQGCDPQVGNAYAACRARDQRVLRSDLRAVHAEVEGVLGAHMRVDLADVDAAEVRTLGDP